MRTFLPLVLAGLVIAAGCAQKAPVVTVPAQKAPGTPGPEHAGDVSAQDLGKVESNYKAAKAAYERGPNDKTKAAYVAATAQLGTATMMSQTLDSKVKYREALKYYREALKFDPKNQESLQNKLMIEDIYKQMGRPVPE